VLNLGQQSIYLCYLWSYLDALCLQLAARVEDTLVLSLGCDDVLLLALVEPEKYSLKNARQGTRVNSKGYSSFPSPSRLHLLTETAKNGLCLYEARNFLL
jgi:hypothetical protein